MLKEHSAVVDQENIAVAVNNGNTDVEMQLMYSPREGEEDREVLPGFTESPPPPPYTGVKKNAQSCVDQAQTEKLFLQHRWRILVSLWVLGLVNNFHYNLVIAAADSLAGQYNMKHLVALVSFANVFFGIIARIMNAFVANRLSFNLRMTLMVVMTVTGLFLNAFSGPIGGHRDGICFFVVIVGVSFSGTAYSYGEAVALTFLQRYPSYMVGAWGSGTGISGVITSILYILLTNSGVSKQYIFLCSAPLTIVYWVAFCLALVAPQKVVYATHTNGMQTPHILQRGREEVILASLRSSDIVEVSEYEIKMFSNLKGLSWHSIPRQVVSAEVKNVLRVQDDPENLHYPCCQKFLGCLSPTNFLRDWWHFNGADIALVHKAMWWFFLNLAVVYVSEYAAQFMAPFSFFCTPEWESNFFVRNSYPITQVCYQLGVFISRSSLSLIQIKWVGVLSILQIINAIAWLIQAKTLLISSKTNMTKEEGLYFILFAWMIYVGLVAGSSYVNCFFLILQKNIVLQEKDVELRMTEVTNREKQRSATEARKPDEITGRPVDASSSDEDSNGADADYDEHLVEEARQHLMELWQRRRELAMATGSLYGMCGICLGTILDVIFTNTLLKNTSSCKGA